MPRCRERVIKPSPVWSGSSSLRVSMIITLLSVVAQSPFAFDFSRYIKERTLQRVFAMLPAVQHMYSPLVYVMFFPQYRAVLHCGWSRLVRGTAYQWKHAATTAPTPSVVEPAVQLILLRGGHSHVAE
ncbi:hypothetical protein BV898_02781 [Hypsibius exemplaris]|uniref:Uncharacterized protein n=1 Tax=Hypsibius exemplaris TaxID=2072580 RepID=A0A1W0X756_HYPEX|nr:hypothetical protein BV898_02781 [Hypsibius exemplaris]